MGSGELRPCSALLAHVAFTLPLNLSLSQLRSFPTFTLPVLSPTREELTEHLCEGLLPAGVKPQH